MVTARIARFWPVVLLVVCSTGCRDGRDPAERASPQSRFRAVSDGVVRDSRSGLLWTSRDNGQSLAWVDAERHCAALALAGSTLWRLPEVDELADLYDETVQQPCGPWTCRVDRAIRLSDPYFWSATGRQSTRRFYVDFRFGTRLAPVPNPALVRRVLCVRDR